MSANLRRPKNESWKKFLFVVIGNTSAETRRTWPGERGNGVNSLSVLETKNRSKVQKLVQSRKKNRINGVNGANRVDVNDKKCENARSR